MCPICEVDEETSEHAFLLCPWVSPIWFGLYKCKVPTNMSISSLWKWLLDMVIAAKSDDPELLTNVGYALWNIWMNRNDWIFEGET